MCLVIDANVAHYFKDPLNVDALRVRDWVEERAGRLVVGGRNAAELANVSWMRSWLVELNRAGLMRRISDTVVDTEELALVKSAQCKSDDPHIIALARKSGARILYSHDKPLHQDFGEKALVDKPRGRVYQNITHSHLLNDANCGSAI